MDDSQRGIAGRDIGHDQPDGPHISHKVEGLSLLGHLLVDRIDMLRTSADLGPDIVTLQQSQQVGLDGFDLLLTVWTSLLDLFGDLLVLFRVEIPEAQVFQFPLDLPDAKPICQRCKNIQGFLGDALALVFGHKAQRAHIVQAVCQLDQYHADVVPHGQECLAQCLGNKILFASETGAVLRHFRRFASVAPI